MAEQNLNDAHIRASLQHVRGAGVTKRMRRHDLRQTGALAGIQADLADCVLVDGMVDISTRKEPGLRALDLKGMGYLTLMRVWIQEGIRREKKKAS